MGWRADITNNLKQVISHNSSLSSLIGEKLNRLNNDKMDIDRYVRPPAYANSEGKKGEKAVDEKCVYECIDRNYWVKYERLPFREFKR